MNEAMNEESVLDILKDLSPATQSDCDVTIDSIVAYHISEE